MADRIAQACTPADLAARQGGEEFALLLGVRDLDSARQRAETLRAVVAAEPLAPNGQPIAVSVSIGLTLAKPEDETLDQLLRRADHALYAAKAAGRNRVICG